MTSPESHVARISPIQDRDIPEILAIYNHYVVHSMVTFDEEPMSLDAYITKVALIKDAGLPFVVARSFDDRVLGYAYASPWRPKSAYRYAAESTIYLAEAAVGHGAGRALLEELMTASADAGVRELIAVISDRGADRSIALHKRAGFVPIGHLQRVGYKFGQWLGTEMLQKSLV